ncbi:MAG: SUMF1/EgtB/PvdO family nonheme iron enzyme [Proteobacteria bacterium]|nr:SUMF1/EgtB/PvdO family nonheme iron enzyme [Pseudomonadota bacterium]
MLGTMVGKYRITAELGQGATGIVYEAYHDELDKRVVIKMLRSRLSANKRILQRFADEAKAAASIHHPGIVDVIDVDRHHDGRSYIVMEYLAGETLARRLRRVGQLSQSTAVSFARQAASALAAAHEKGIVHRDLKPDNIFLVSGSEVAGGERIVLLDFGNAKLMERGRALTSDGALLGTPPYMSPEQCRGAKHVDHRTDLYSLGVILFEMLSGRQPFSELTRADYISAHLYKRPPQVTLYNADVAPELADILSRLLDKDRARRVQSAGELTALLSRIEPGGDSRLGGRGDVEENRDESAETRGMGRFRDRLDRAMRPAPSATPLDEEPTRVRASDGMPAVVAPATKSALPVVPRSIQAPSPSRPYDVPPATINGSDSRPAAQVAAQSKPPPPPEHQASRPEVPAENATRSSYRAEQPLHRSGGRRQPHQVSRSRAQARPRRTPPRRESKRSSWLSLFFAVVVVAAVATFASFFAWPGAAHRNETSAANQTVTDAGDSAVATEQAVSRRSVPLTAGTLGVVHVALAGLAPMQFIGLPGGEFAMGSPTGEKGRVSDERLHLVRVAGFAIAEHEVTQRQWRAVMNRDPSDCDAGCGDDLPVQNVSWRAAVEFLNRLSKRDSVAPCYAEKGRDVVWNRSCDGYRLPTEAEWEYACRAGSGRAYSFGDDDSALGQYAWYSDNARGRVHRVASRKPNRWGLYDLHGNVLEWTWDWSAPYSGGIAVRNPSESDRATESRVLRGGSFTGGPWYLRCARRHSLRPSRHSPGTGLRAVRNHPAGAVSPPR